MKRICMAACLLVAWVALAGWCVAQSPGPALSVPNTDIYGGFLVTSPDYGPHWDSYLLYGAEADVSKALSRRLWITAAGDYVAGTHYDVKQASATVGPTFFFLTGKWRPYATGQVGFAWQRSHGFYAGDHHPPLAPGAIDIERGFSYRFGGGVEYQFFSRLYWRVQWDYQPQPWARHTPFYQNVGGGIGYRF
jgi:hypothetical protein